MAERLAMRIPLFVRHALYVMRGGFLVRPLLIALALGFAGMTLSWLEERAPGIGAWLPQALFPSREDPQIAQVILSGIATSIMTVVSIVFAILLMSLTLASMQFSPRILISFVRDGVTQWTLGIFLGTFTYCMAALPAARNAPHPFSPVLTVAGAMVLALMCVGWLLFFINHISQAISVTHIVDRIAGETEDVIDSIMPHSRTARTQRHFIDPDLGKREHLAPVTVTRSGYIRFVDIGALMALALKNKARIRLSRRVGQFVPTAFPLFNLTHLEAFDEADLAALRSAVDIGPVRTLEQDVEFGVLQIVDIALRAISPAVNDPSTAINCIDQLTRILIRWIGRDLPDTYIFNPPLVVRLAIPWIGTSELLDTAFDQIRHYAANDAAVTMRLLRAMADIARVADPPLQTDLLARGRNVVEGVRRNLPAQQLLRVEARGGELELVCGVARGDTLSRIDPNQRRQSGAGDNTRTPT